MISLLYHTPFLAIVIGIGAVMFTTAKQGKPEKSRFLEFLLLTVATVCVFLFDNPLRSNPYAGLLFYAFDIFIFTPVSLACGFTAVYKSTKHLKYYPSGYSKFLRINSWLLAIFSLINFLFLMLTEEMGILILLPVFGISSIIQFIIGEIERKRVQKLLEQRKEDAVIQNPETTEDEPLEN